MSERLILELKSKFKNEIDNEEEIGKEELEINDPEINKTLEDIRLTLKSLNYKNEEIKTIMPSLIKEMYALNMKEKNASFENLLKLAMDNIDNDSSNLDR